MKTGALSCYLEIILAFDVTLDIPDFKIIKTPFCPNFIGSIL